MSPPEDTQVSGLSHEQRIERLEGNVNELRTQLASVKSEARRDRELFQSAIEEVNDKLQAIRVESHTEHLKTTESLDFLRKTTAETNVLLAKLLALEVDPGMSAK